GHAFICFCVGLLATSLFLIVVFILCGQYTSTPYIYPLSLHDALPIWSSCWRWYSCNALPLRSSSACSSARRVSSAMRRLAEEERSEEHTSELQSLTNLVCRLLLEQHNLDKWWNYHQTIRMRSSTP